MCHPAVATAVVRWGWPDPNDERVEWMRTHVASVPSVGAALSGAAFSQLASTSEQDDFHVMPSVDISLSSTAPARMGATLVSEEEADNYHEDAAIERVKQKKGHKVSCWVLYTVVEPCDVGAPVMILSPGCSAL